ncbi:MAG: O-succinylhomoserine sulfhydrylase [Candidatus Desulfobacillus denitrificans]|jgi:O-succinylhomoserine sulfhydrylase|uniref:O-succinylhomoserine sulfhydrylase n=1 Tax=Candidatus Desulfobacillus denitrificans TaxID=2608985 RepID=A0A809QY64_9PROT|nr:O-succinylhomoserine sulfhydrylase [Rhodocyclaceae bacterium]MCZ2175693.1 O-succinylhomoserine sulfhydrylase [Burkholderiales bacterium]BBO20363.1 O-succinylhomoserine sulfhydrylase [Candidatus Desulfobacillus denitrificans]GIK44565.1 MAG: O-succinylhomoserine sulfhydrylase [Betaproteobacteria bacterium]GJQ54808.1 MAG: O-succinylhomoserine sulfhydrylase [Rhodocyclaceae bacterium]
MDKDFDLDTLAVRAGIQRSQFNEHAEALYLTSSFVFDNAAQAAARFSGEEAGFVYGRFSNPTVSMLQERLAALEGGEACIATASGMAAILSTVMALMKAGEHIVASQSIFGATQQLFGGILSKFGVDTTFVASTEPAAFRAALRPQTKLVFIETPSNPLTEVFDIAALAEVAHAGGALLAVDNCFCSPALQRPLHFGADLVIHSATKYLDGQGRVLGGAVVGCKALTEEVFKFLRTAGPSISPFNAWVILKGLETLRLRMEAQSAAALKLARWLEAQPRVGKVYYPGLPSHPQHELAMRQQKTGGAIVSFEVKGGRAEAWQVVDATRLISITANLGDTKSTITHPASTTHGRISASARAAAGIQESLLRVAVGLESVEDLQADLARGLALI